MNIKLLGYFFKNIWDIFYPITVRAVQLQKKLFKYPVKVIGFQCVKLLLMLKQF